MKYLLVILSFAFISCSQMAEQKEYSSAKRVSYLEADEVRPKFYFKHLPKDNSNSRSPASIAEEDTGNTSLRAVYFEALWKQKKDMESILGLSSDNYCPAFHHQVLGFSYKTDNNYFSTSQMHKRVSKTKNPLKYPVLALPYEGSDLYSYSQENNIEQEDVHSALENFYKLTKSEVDNLCETGVSEGYFMTKNLADYYAIDKEFRNSQKFIEAMLKTPYIANLYVLNSFKVRKFNTINGVELLSHLHAKWFSNYLDTVSSNRNNRISKNESLR